MTTLVIIESPGKRKKLEAILGAGYRVRASFGHVRDLPVKEIGVEAPTYRPTYVTEDSRAQATLKALRAEVRDAETVLLATDPDREGEAIAWHLAEALKLRRFARVSYSEVTPEAVRRAVASPRPIDMALVHAQEGRRVLDRLVGYLVSPALSSAGGEKLSAGRVQSPALRLVVERDRAIAAFRVTEHFGARLSFGSWSADLMLPDGLDQLMDKAVAVAASEVRSLVVRSCSDSVARKAPPPPFTTSSLQQVALTRLKLAPEATMKLAQALYEAGAITYMRSDSPNLSAEAYEKIAAAGHPVVGVQRRFKAKEGAQEGHEAIRPTDFAVRTLEGEGADLYALIYARAVASQMADARFAVRAAILDGGGFAFEARGRTLIEAGWRALLGDDDDDAPPDNAVPALADGAALTAVDGQVLLKKTKAPARFTQGSLIAALESHGIGRPSTYAAILSTLERRGYVLVGKGASLTATDIGARLVDALCGRFGFIDLDYTRFMEAALDEVAGGGLSYVRVVTDAHERLRQELGTLPAAAAPPAGPPCPVCAGATRRRVGSRGAFWSCCAYPECKGTVNIPGASQQAAPRVPASTKRSGTRSSKAPGRGARKSTSLVRKLS